MSKFKLTTETKTINGVSLYRIEALKDFGDVKVGDLGGWVESESNLSQDGNAWVYDDAQVYGNAKVYDDAKVYGTAWVSGEAWVHGNAEIYDNVMITGWASVSGDDIGEAMGGTEL